MTTTNPTAKSLNDIAIGDVVLAMGANKFDAPLTVQDVVRFNGSVVNVVLVGGRFWPMQPGRAEATTITVAA